MPLLKTEHAHPLAQGLDALPADEVLHRLFSAQRAAVEVVEHAIPEIADGADLMAAAMRDGGRLVYVGAGSSALMAITDGLELPGTYGIDPARIRLLMAGGLPQDAHMPGATEDDLTGAAKDAADLRADDTVIAVTASGQTPYPLEIARRARKIGARIVAIANNADAAIFALADAAICLPTPPELIAGSTRMGAGTAQKLALNMMSTLMAVRLNAVHDGMMVDLVADNDKLRARAAGIVAVISGSSDKTVAAALQAANGAIKPAVLIASGASPDDSAELIAKCDGNLRAALAHLKDNGPKSRGTTTNQGRE